MNNIVLGVPTQNIIDNIKSRYPQNLCFTAEEADAQIVLNKEGSPNEIHLQVSEDGVNWLDDEYVCGDVITLDNIGDKVYFRSNPVTGTGKFSADEENLYYFSTNDKKIAASGNIMSLVDPTCAETTIHDEYQFCYLFYDASLTKAPELPATTLAEGCYLGMFGQTDIVQAPVLPATTLASYCYSEMFYECTSLTQAPVLSSTTLASYCYCGMFQNCTLLTSVPVLPATTLSTCCYRNMFYTCTSLSTPPELPATTLATGCYQSMFYNCSSLTSSPELPAIKLASSCYWRMFQNCISLSSAPELPATTLASNCYYAMFQNCIALSNATICAQSNITNKAQYMLSNCLALCSCAIAISSAETMTTPICNCSNLSDLYFPNLTMQIAKDTDAGKQMLKNVIYPTAQIFNTTIHCSDGSFIPVVSDLYVASSLKQKYMADTANFVNSMSVLNTLSVTSTDQTSTLYEINMIKTFEPQYYCLNAGNVQPLPISRYVLAAVDHFRVHQTGNVTYSDISSSCTVTRNSWVNLRAWAIQNRETYGWTEDEVSSICEDIDVIPLNKDKGPVADQFIYYTLDLSTFNALSTSMCSDGADEYFLVWKHTQLMKNKNSYPQPVFTKFVTYSSSTPAFYNQIRFNHYTIPSELDAMLVTYDNDVKSKLKQLTPFTHGADGDSGLPQFIKFNDKRVLLGLQHGAWMISGTNIGKTQVIDSIPHAFKYIKQYVMTYEGTTEENCSLKEFTINDLNEYIQS